MPEDARDQQMAEQTMTDRAAPLGTAAVPEDGTMARRHKDSRRTAGIALALTDLIMLQVLLAVALGLRLALADLLPVIITTEIYRGVAIALMLMPLAWLAAGLYPGDGLPAPDRLRRRSLTTVIGFLLLASWDYVLQGHEWSRGLAAIAWLLALIVLPITEALVIGRLIRVGRWGRKVALYGSGHAVRDLSVRLQSDPALGFIPAVRLTDLASSVTGTDAGDDAGLPQMTVARARAQGIDTAIVCLPPSALDQAPALTWSLDFPRVLLRLEVDGLPSLSTRTRELGGRIGIEISRGMLEPRKRHTKRVLDHIIAVLALIPALPIIGLAALAVKIADPGPAFFVQERGGKSGRTIRVLKLRTMYRDADARLAAHLEADPAAAEDWRRFYKLKRDPRVLPVVGGILRRTSMDELPQVLNVLTGEMSVVGPRPFPAYHLAAFDEPFRRLRGSVRPGITGLWQVSVRSDGDLDAQQALDSFYIRNWSVWLDLVILGRTVGAVVRGGGAR